MAGMFIQFFFLPHLGEYCLGNSRIASLKSLIMNFLGKKIWWVGKNHFHVKRNTLKGRILSSNPTPFPF